jgi:hypothetical protein
VHVAGSLNLGSGLANGGNKLVFNLKKFIKGYRYFGQGEGPCGLKGEMASKVKGKMAHANQIV